MMNKKGRLEKILKRDISYVLANEVKDKNIKFITITDVSLTNDLSIAKIYFTVLDDENKEEIINSLLGASSFVWGKLHDLIEIRIIPELKFVYDESIAYGNKIETIISELKKEKE